MPRIRTLTSHTAIRNWVKFRNGQPAISTTRNSRGQPRQKLALAFRGRLLQRPDAGVVGDGTSPCSWDAWLAELDRQHLALQVTDSDDDDIQPCDIDFVSRDAVH